MRTKIDRMPLFSIITATRNEGLSFLRTYESLAEQTYRSFEWVVFDASEDVESIAIVDSCIDSINILVRGFDRSISDAWNKSIKICRGCYILFLNAGDTYSPDFLDTLSVYIDNSNIYCGHSTVMSSRGAPLSLFLAKPDRCWVGMHIPHNWMAVPKYMYTENGNFSDIKFAFDYEYTLRLLSRYGRDAFKTLPVRSYGCYYLGGLSDKWYRKSLLASLHISCTYGLPRHAAFRYFILYYLKTLFHRNYARYLYYIAQKYNLWRCDRSQSS